MEPITLTKDARAFISPSDLTFGWDNCHRCLWLYYNHQVKAPLFMPLVGDLAEMQELSCIGKTSAELNTNMPEGKVFKHAGWVVSKPIEVDVVVNYDIEGSYSPATESECAEFPEININSVEVFQIQNKISIMFLIF